MCHIIPSLSLCLSHSGFADRFAGRGAGIEADNTDNGVLFDFLVAPGCTLLISVVAGGEEIAGGNEGIRGNGLNGYNNGVSGVYSSLRVIAKLSSPASSANDFDGVAGSDTDMGVRGMVMKAAGNVLASLKKDLAGLIVETGGEILDQERETHQEQRSNVSMDQSNVSLEQSKDPRLGSQASSMGQAISASASASATSRLKPLSVSDIGPAESHGALVDDE